MSAYKNVKLGIYFLVKPQSIVASKTIKTCSNKDCKDHGKEVGWQFCPKCGSAILLETLKENVMTSCIYKLFPNFDQVSESIQSALFSPAYPPSENFNMPQFDIDGIETVDLMDEETVVEPLNKDDAVSLALKDTTVQEVIKNFTSVYGEDSISVHYGVYSFSH